MRGGKLSGDRVKSGSIVRRPYNKNSLPVLLQRKGYIGWAEISRRKFVEANPTADIARFGIVPTERVSPGIYRLKASERRPIFAKWRQIPAHDRIAAAEFQRIDVQFVSDNVEVAFDRKVDLRTTWRPHVARRNGICVDAH